MYVYMRNIVYETCAGVINFACITYIGEVGKQNWANATYIHIERGVWGLLLRIAVLSIAATFIVSL